VAETGPSLPAPGFSSPSFVALWGLADAQLSPEWRRGGRRVRMLEIRRSTRLATTLSWLGTVLW
jgi:hypothetical protein